MVKEAAGQQQVMMGRSEQAGEMGWWTPLKKQHCLSLTTSEDGAPAEFVGSTKFGRSANTK